MRILIIEDERLAAVRLQNLLKDIDPTMEIAGVIDSVEDTIAWLQEFRHPDLIFMDIMLADGQSFEIFEHVEIKVPIIFTTAYDEFAIKAFKVNSIDYLLKPVDPNSLELALKKFKALMPSPENFKEVMESLLVNRHQIPEPHSIYKNRFLVKSGDKFIPIAIAEVAYFSFEDKLTFLHTVSNKRHMLSHTLDELEQLVDPKLYFRLNRQFIASFASIKTVHNFFNGKLKVYIKSEMAEGIIISKDKAHFLKEWLNR